MSCLMGKKTRFLIITILTFFSPVCALSAFGQGNSDVVSFNQVDIRPKFDGKEANEFAKWLTKNIIYPPIAMENGVQGRVMIQFIVNIDGSVSDVKVVKSVDRSLDQEAVRVVSKSPKWTPGKMNDGSAVRVLYTYPVVFSLK